MNLLPVVSVSRVRPEPNRLVDQGTKRGNSERPFQLQVCELWEYKSNEAITVFGDLDRTVVQALVSVLDVPGGILSLDARDMIVLENGWDDVERFLVKILQ